MEFKDKLKQLRNEFGISQTELAEKIFVSRSAVAKWESGLGLPNDDSLNLLSEFFSVPKEQLIDNVETENIRIDKNKLLLKQKNLTIIFLSLFLGVFFAFFVTVVCSLTFNDYNPFVTKIIDGVKYTRINDENGQYYRIDGLHSSRSKNTVVFENEIGGLPVRCINENVFANTNLGEVYFNDNLTKIGSQAFYYADIEKIYFNEGLTEIGFYSFRYSSLKEAKLPSTLKIIGYGAFYGCDDLEDITFGGNLELVESFAFACCHKLNKITFNSNVKIEGLAFTHTDLTEVEFLQPSVMIEDAGFAYNNFILNKVTYNGTIGQFNEVFGEQSFGRYSLYLKTADSRDYYECGFNGEEWVPLI